MAYRINTTNKDEDLFGTDKHGWKNGISPPTTATAGTDDYFNHAQEEVARVAESQGYTIPEEESATDRYDMMLSALRMQNFATQITAIKVYTLIAHTPTRIAGGTRVLTANYFSEIFVFCAVEDGDQVYTWSSTGGMSSARTAPGSPTNIYDVVWSESEGYFVLVGDGGKIWTMVDDVTPISRTSGTANDLRTIAYDGTIYVAGGASGTIVTSADGITWATRTSNLSGTIRAIAHNGTIFLASDDTAGGDVSTSSDGITWTGQTVTGLDADISVHRMVWNAARSRWYGLAENLASTPREAQIVSSADGIAWVVEQLVGSTDSELEDISVSPGGIMAVTTLFDTDGFLISDGRHPWKKVRSLEHNRKVGAFIEGMFVYSNTNEIDVCGELV